MGAHGGGPLKIPRRGASIAAVLMISSVILVVGLALGTLCTLNLNFARQALSQKQSEMVARAAVAQVDFELDQSQRAANQQSFDVATPPRFFNVNVTMSWDRQPEPVQLTTRVYLAQSTK